MVGAMAMSMPQMQPPTLIIMHKHYMPKSQQVGAMAILMPQMQPPTLIIIWYFCMLIYDQL